MEFIDCDGTVGERTRPPDNHGVTDDFDVFALVATGTGADFPRDPSAVTGGGDRWLT